MGYKSVRGAALGAALLSWMGLAAFGVAEVAVGALDLLLMGFILAGIAAVIATIAAVVVWVLPPPLAAWQLGRRHAEPGRGAARLHVVREQDVSRAP